MTIKQVIVMRTDLNMRKGKMIAQGAHASIAWMTSRLRTKGSVSIEKRYHSDWQLKLSAEEQLWIEGRFTKICVRVDSEEDLLRVHQEAVDSGLTSHLITDAGLTEFDGVPTLTCLAIGPNLDVDIDKITGELKLL